jgi:hypothetical protein
MAVNQGWFLEARRLPPVLKWVAQWRLQEQLDLARPFIGGREAVGLELRVCGLLTRKAPAARPCACAASRAPRLPTRPPRTGPCVRRPPCDALDGGGGGSLRLSMVGDRIRWEQERARPHRRVSRTGTKWNSSSDKLFSFVGHHLYSLARAPAMW